MTSFQPRMLLVLVLALASLSGQSFGQEVTRLTKKPIRFEMGIGAANSLVWRGEYTPGFNIQPTITFNYGNLTLGSWVFTNFDKNKMIELSASYSIKNLSFTLIDYWIDKSDFDRGYFIYDNKRNLRALELIGQYTLKQTPLSLAWSTFFFKEDVNENGRRLYSSYAELKYNFSYENFNFNTFAGATPWAGLYQSGKGFKIINIGFDAETKIFGTETISIPFFTQAVLNLYREELYWIVGLRFNLHTKQPKT